LYALLGLFPLLFYRRTSLIDHARRLEQRYDLQGTLVNSIQLSTLLPDSREHYSPDLIQAYIDRTSQEFLSKNPAGAVDTSPLHRAGLILSVALILSLLYPAFAPARFWFGIYRRIDYHMTRTAYCYTRGDNVPVGIHFFGVYQPSSVQLIQQNEEGTVITRLSIEDDHAHTVITANHRFHYGFSFFEHHTPVCTVEVMDPLAITALVFELKYPDYMRLPDEKKLGRQLLVPQQTQVSLRGTASHELFKAYLFGEDTISLICEGSAFSGNFTVYTTETRILHLEGNTRLDEEIIVYAIPDIPPQIDVFYPGFNVMIPQTMEMEIGIQCSDDYGLKTLRFVHTFRETTVISLPVTRNALEDTLTYTWDMSALQVLPGDEIVYYAEVTDNAGHTTRSRSYSVYFPTMEEIYEEISETEDYIAEDLHAAQAEHVKEIEELARIQETIMEERELSWADQEKLQAVLKKEEQLLEKIDAWQAELERTIEQLEKGMVLDQQSIERLREISRIMQEIAPDELKAALERFDRIAEQDPQHMQAAIEQLKEHKEELAKALERTLEILQRFQQEVALQELAHKAETLSDQASTLDSLAHEQEHGELESLADEYREGMTEFQQKLEELAESQGLEQELQTALQEMARQAASMRSEIPQNPQQQAKKLTGMSGELKQWYERITKGRTAQLRKKLMDMLNQLIEISKVQEELTREGRQLDIEQQYQILTATRAVAESLSAQSSQSMYITKHLIKTMAKALVSMERTIHAEPAVYAQYTNESMRLINLVALEMLNNLEQIAQGEGSSTGLDKFLEQLANISQGQMTLNQSLFNLFPLPQPGLSPQQQAQLSKLAATQQALREALQSLQEKYSGAEYGSMMEKIIQDMQETEQALNQHRLDRELIERQQKILTRLLDAQKSIRSADYGKKRKSTPGSPLVAEERPGPLPLDLGKNDLQILLQRALREPLPEAYEVYIREYFKRLIEEP
jgi:hypothetical protein